MIIVKNKISFVATHFLLLFICKVKNSFSRCSIGYQEKLKTQIIKFKTPYFKQYVEMYRLF